LPSDRRSLTAESGWSYANHSSIKVIARLGRGREGGAVGRRQSAACDIYIELENNMPASDPVFPIAAKGESLDDASTQFLFLRPLRADACNPAGGCLPAGGCFGISPMSARTRNQDEEHGRPRQIIYIYIYIYIYTALHYVLYVCVVCSCGAVILTCKAGGGC
jgi:hypothetical protein